MAERRMFAKTIIDSDAFLDMSTSAQALYFHLGMRADDEGFVNNPKKIQRMTGASDDDLKILIAKKFIIPFESGIVVIKHWKIHNYIRGDRMQETKYHKEKRLLSLNENDAYALTPVEISGNVTSESPQERTVRQMAYDKSSLPYSFDYKIRNAFYGKTCPVCGATMVIDKEFGGRNSIPSIQHNVPVSKGGEHEIGNISVICKQCNVTLQDKETDSLNADEVAVVWDELSGKCQASDGQVSGECQHRLGKDRLEIGKDSTKVDKPRFAPPALDDVKAYCSERKNTVDPEHWYSYYEANGWMVGRNKMKDWKASVRTWEKNGYSGGRNSKQAQPIEYKEELPY